MGDYLTLEQVRDRLPEVARPPIRALRERADALGLPRRRWNRQRVLTEAEAQCLLASEKEAVSGTLAARSQCAKRMVGSRRSVFRNQLERSVKLEQLGLLPTSRNTTTNKPTGQKPRLVHPSQTRP